MVRTDLARGHVRQFDFRCSSGIATELAVGFVGKMWMNLVRQISRVPLGSLHLDA